MKKIVMTLSILIAGIFFTNARAQGEEEMKKWMEHMTPSDVHKMMAKWDGEWNEEVQMWMDPSADPQTMKASCVNKMILGGRYQESWTKGTFNGMPFEGRSLLAWDNTRKLFVSTWIDNFGTGIMYLEGSWDEKTKSMNLKGTMTDPMSGELIKVRQVMKFINDNTQVMEQYDTREGKENKSMVITFTRK